MNVRHIYVYHTRPCATLYTTYGHARHIYIYHIRPCATYIYIPAMRDIYIYTGYHIQPCATYIYHIRPCEIYIYRIPHTGMCDIYIPDTTLCVAFHVTGIHMASDATFERIGNLPSTLGATPKHAFALFCVNGSFFHQLW